MAPDQTSNQPPAHTTLPWIEDHRPNCDRCRRARTTTTIYRCPSCDQQYCTLCWQLQLRNCNGQHSCLPALAASTSRGGPIMATGQASNQPPMHGSFLNVRRFNARCDQCRKHSYDTDVYRCEQQNCMMQYCTACWQGQPWDVNGKHLCNRASILSSGASGVGTKKKPRKESAKANEKVAIPVLKRKRSIAAINGNEAHVEKRAETPGGFSPAQQTTQADKKQRKDGAQVPHEREDSAHPGLEVVASLHDDSHT